MIRQLYLDIDVYRSVAHLLPQDLILGPWSIDQICNEDHYRGGGRNILIEVDQEWVTAARRYIKKYNLFDLIAGKDTKLKVMTKIPKWLCRVPGKPHCWILTKQG